MANGFVARRHKSWQGRRICGKALTAPATVAPQQPRALLSSQQGGSDFGGCCVWGGQQLCFFWLEQRSQSLPLPHPHNPTPTAAAFSDILPQMQILFVPNGQSPPGTNVSFAPNLGVFLSPQDA